MTPYAQLLLPLSFSFRKMSNAPHIFCIFFLFFCILNSGQILCHTKGIRPRSSPKWKQPTINMTRAQFSEQQFMKWVKFVGSLKHSLFKAAKNKIFPSYTITVAKNPAAGDFTSIQQAIDSLPFINLVRVVIKVHSGVYTSVFFSYSFWATCYRVLLELCLFIYINIYIYNRKVIPIFVFCCVSFLLSKMLSKNWSLTN